MRFGPGARRVEHHRLDILELDGHHRLAEQIARLGRHRLQPLREAQRFLERRNRRAVAVGGINLCALRQPEGEGPHAAEEIGNGFRLAHALEHQCRQHVFGHGRRLKEAADRDFDAGLAHADRGRPGLQHHLAIERQARHVGALREEGQFLRLQPFVRTYRDIEPGVGRGEGHVAIADRRGNRPGEGRRSRLQRRHEDRALGDVDQLMAARRHIAHRLATRMQRRPPASVAMGRDGRLQHRFHACHAQGVFHQAALQRVIGGRAVMLQRAAAAGAEIGTEGIGGVFRRLKHPAL